MSKNKLISYMKKYPVKDVLKILNIKPTKFKYLCREYGIKRWIHRKYNSQYNIVRKFIDRDLLINYMNLYTQVDAMKELNLTKLTINKLCHDFQIGSWKKGKYLDYYPEYNENSGIKKKFEEEHLDELDEFDEFDDDLNQLNSNENNIEIENEEIQNEETNSYKDENEVNELNEINEENEQNDSNELNYDYLNEINYDNSNELNYNNEQNDSNEVSDDNQINYDNEENFNNQENYNNEIYEDELIGFKLISNDYLEKFNNLFDDEINEDDHLHFQNKSEIFNKRNYFSRSYLKSMGIKDALQFY